MGGEHAVQIAQSDVFFQGWVISTSLKCHWIAQPWLRSALNTEFRLLSISPIFQRCYILSTPLVCRLTINVDVRRYNPFSRSSWISIGRRIESGCLPSDGLRNLMNILVSIDIAPRLISPIIYLVGDSWGCRGYFGALVSSPWSPMIQPGTLQSQHLDESIHLGWCFLSVYLNNCSSLAAIKSSFICLA